MGSLKWASKGSNQPSSGTQSESMKATTGVLTWASPAFRAAEGPALTDSAIRAAPARAASSRVRATSAEASSTTTQAIPGSAERRRRS